MKMVFVASIVRHKGCIIHVFFDFFFVQKSFLTKNYFLVAAIHLTTRGPLYTFLVSNRLQKERIYSFLLISFTVFF